LKHKDGDKKKIVTPDTTVVTYVRQQGRDQARTFIATRRTTARSTPRTFRRPRRRATHVTRAAAVGILTVSDRHEHDGSRRCRTATASPPSFAHCRDPT